MFSKHRLEILSDGVFAIVMTLLILDIKAPAGIEPGQLRAALLSDSSQWISFCITFALAAVFWTLQHKVFDALEEVSSTSLILTFVFLGFVTVLPFTTSVWGHYSHEPLSFVLYFANQFALGATLTAKVETARVQGHLKAGVRAKVLRLRLYVMTIAMGLGVVSAWALPLVHLPFVCVAVLPLLTTSIGRMIQRRKERNWKEIEIPPPVLTEQAAESAS